VLWEQFSLPIYVFRKRALLVSLCTMHPILASHVVTLLDVSFKANPKFFTAWFALWYSSVFHLSIKRFCVCGATS
jgi:hypothetical protein